MDQYKPVGLDFAVPARAIWTGSAWTAQVQTQGSAWYDMRVLAEPQVVNGTKVAAEQVNGSGRVCGYLRPESVAALTAQIAALGAPEIDLEATRAVLNETLSYLRETAYQARHDAIEAARTSGRFVVPRDYTSEIAVARAELLEFCAAHPELSSREPAPAVVRALNCAD